MENMWLAAGIATVAALALFRLRQMMRWVPGEARFLGIAKPVLWGTAHAGQALPISFLLPDGAEVRTELRNYSRGGLPPVGSRLRVRYDPASPERAEWAAAVPLLALVLAVLLAALFVVLRRLFRDGGFIV